MTKPSQIRSSGDLPRHVKALVYSFPGIGKTRFLGTSPGKVLVLECGKGETDTIAAAGQKVDVWEVFTRQDLTEAYEYCRHEGYSEYDWIWVDGLSPLEDRLMKERLAVTHAQSPHRSDTIPSQDLYLDVQSIVDKYVGYFVDLPVHCGFTAHVMIESVRKFESDDDGDMMEVEVDMMMPQIQGGRGKLSQKVCGRMNVVGYMDFMPGENGNQRGILVGQTNRHVAKDRYDVLGNSKGWFMNPTVPKMQELVESKLVMPGKAKPTKKAAKGVTKKATKTATKKTTGLRRSR